MRSTGLGMGLGLGLVGLLAAPACESQVGEDYEGEVQFSLEGTVHNADSGLRPRLAFLEENGVIFVDGTVTGSFPSKFRFDVTEAPPPEAVAFGGGGDDLYAGKLAVGFIAMMPEGTPDRLPNLETVESDLPGEGCDADGHCVWYETTCNPTGSCRDRTIECEPCEVIGDKGDPALRNPDGPYTATWTTYGGYVTGITSYCESETNCYHEYAQCDLTDPLASAALHGVERCTVVEESGDTTLVDPYELATSANQYFVVYAVEDVTTEFGTLEQGYNLLYAGVPTLEEMKEAPLECDSSSGQTSCIPEFPLPRIVDSSDVSIDLGFPPM